MTYWTDVDPPMSFIPEGWSYEQKRSFRYECIPYLNGFMNPPRYKGKRILCVGDGSGIDAAEFARAGAHVEVVDLSTKAIELTRKHFLEANLPVEIGQMVVGDVADLLPWSGGTFDAVYSFGVIHHIPEVGYAIREIERVLKPGGEFVGMVYHKESLLYAYSIVARGAREGLSQALAMQTYSERNPGCPHSVAYTRGELQGVLSPHFRSIATEIHYDVIDLPHQRKVRFVVDPKVKSELGWHLCFRAVK